MRRPIKPLVLLIAATLCLAACDPAVMAPEPAVAVEDSPLLLDIAPVSERASSSPRRAAPTPRRGVVTAGDIDDTLNLASFRRYQSRMAEDLKLPRLNLADAVRLQVHNADGTPAPGVLVYLRSPGAADPFYSGYSGVDGRLTVFPRVIGAGKTAAVDLTLFGAAQTSIRQRVETGDRVHKITLPTRAQTAPQFLDLVFVFDTTGSMGDELAWLQKEFTGLARVAQRAAPDADIRFGLVAYRDKGDAYVTRRFGFFERPARLTAALRGLDAAGGGDYPEAARAALEQALAMPWRRGQGKRLIFHVTDAPPHQSDARGFLHAARQAARSDIRIHGLGASGVGDASEFMMRQAAVVTGGRYLFLTDDSGVGRPHAEPRIACYRVTALKSLLERVLTSEMTGRRIEARQNDVIRTVGRYDGGRCLS